MAADDARRLAEDRQQLAHHGTGYCPSWAELAEHEREVSVVEARSWLRAADLVRADRERTSGRFAGPASAVIRAISDPGSILPRLPAESVPEWQTRAVLDAASPHITRRVEADALAAIEPEAAAVADAEKLISTMAELITELDGLADDMLSRFTRTSDGYRARVGQVQIARWQATLRGTS